MISWSHGWFNSYRSTSPWQHFTSTILYILDLKVPPISYTIKFRRPYDSLDISKLLLYSFILVSGTIGNGMVIQAFLRSSGQPGSRFVVGLAVIDLVSSILIPLGNFILITFDHKHWPFGKIGFFILRPWKPSTFYASAWMLVSISLERARYVLFYASFI